MPGGGGNEPLSEPGLPEQEGNGRTPGGGLPKWRPALCSPWPRLMVRLDRKTASIAIDDGQRGNVHSGFLTRVGSADIEPQVKSGDDRKMYDRKIREKKMRSIP